MNNKPDNKTQMNAAMNIEKALAKFRKEKKSLSEKEERFRAALGTRLKLS